MVAPIKPPEYAVSTDIREFNIDWILDRVCKAPWNVHRDAAQVIRACQASLCFGLFRLVDEKVRTQIGFARVVSDGHVFSSITDIFIETGYRKKGLGRLMMASILQHPAVAKTCCVLSSRSACDPAAAQRFYRRCGFANITAMQRDPE